ncbi:MAG TPA: TetR/AcrR family transcriptional regulator [Candidatus Marinimicrobia bacterium]|nr:TetR/AcrR family transcriptional regulator [Candidatus Neomarinimicrobiota bacterium]
MTQNTFPMSKSAMPDKMQFVIESARQDILKNGISSFTIEKHTAKLRISKKTLYNFFPSKDEFIKAALKSHIEDIYDSLAAVPENPEQPLETSLWILQTVFEKNATVSSNTMYEVKLYFPEIWDQTVKLQTDIIGRLSAHFISAQKMNIIRKDVNPNFTSNLIMRIVQDIFQPEFLIDSPYSLSTIIPMFTDLIMNGLLEKAQTVDFHRLMRSISNKDQTE